MAPPAAEAGAAAALWAEPALPAAPQEPELSDFFPFVSCLALAIWLSHVVHVRRVPCLTEASVSLLLGLATGGAYAAVYWARGVPLPSSVLSLDTQFFFDVLLLPILFQAGFSVKKKAFFRNFTVLTLFGVAGTFLTAGLIAVGSRYMLGALGLDSQLVPDSLGLGTVLSSTDSVAALQVLDPEAQPLLFSLVFGEGVVNDATAVVLLRAVQKISTTHAELGGAALAHLLASFSRLFVLSLLLGVGVGLASAALIKRSFVHHSTDREVTLVALLGFLAFSLAERCGLSGILAVFICGATMSHYTWHSLSPSAKVITVYLFRVVSFSAELFLFLYAGVSMWSLQGWSPKLGKSKVMLVAAKLAGAMVLLVLAARAVTVAALTLLANTWRPRYTRISRGEAGVIWWAGSMRGAVTVALSYQQFGQRGSGEPTDHQVICLAVNAAVCLFTVVLGGVTGGLVRWLLGPQDEALLGAYSTLQSLPSLDGASAPLFARALQRSLHWSGRSHVARLWQRLDHDWLYPLFGGRAPRGEAYHSPPPSPGQHVIHQVLGPGIAKRMAPFQQPAATGDANGAGAAAAAAAPVGQPQLQPARRPNSALGAAQSGRNPDAFRLRPAPTEMLGDAETQSALVARAASRAPGRAARGASLLGAHPAALEMQASDALEVLFSQGSSRLDSGRSQQLDWADTAAFGEAAWLAAGAPSCAAAEGDEECGPGEEEAGGMTPLPSVEQQQQEGPQALQGAADPFRHAPSPFQDAPRHG